MAKVLAPEESARSILAVFQASGASSLLKKVFEGSLRATLIQGRHARRTKDSPKANF
jgi:hypothetical protein